MARKRLLAAVLPLLGCASVAPAALAQTAEMAGQTRSVSVTAETRDYSDDRGSIRSLKAEGKFENGGTTVLVAPLVGVRSVNGSHDTAFGMELTLYKDWSETISTRTSLFAAKESPVFARYNVGQDLTFKVADATTLTVGARWSEYFADQEVLFVHVGARRYFNRGSVSYRLTSVKPENRGQFFAHLVNLTINDAHGDGKTQLWLHTGDASAANSQLDDTFSAKNRGVTLQRTQPLGDRLALIAYAGYSTYKLPGDDYEATTFGLGMSSLLGE